MVSAMLADQYPPQHCISCDREIKSLMYFLWERDNVCLCIECIENLYEFLYGMPDLKESPQSGIESSAKKVPIPDDFRWMIWERDNFTCQYCVSRKHLTIDHIIPESQGGELIESNAVACCKSCNSKKGARTPEAAGMKLRNDPRDNTSS